MELTDQQINTANRRAAAKKASLPTVVSVRYDQKMDRMVIQLSSGLELMFSPKQVQGLEHATPADLADIEITPSGLGIHFPKVDADLYLPGLLEGFLGTKRWLAAQMGKVGGSTASSVKAEAARRNGRLGGRPKKNLTDKAA